ncbi:hypothetical protein EJB05_57524, partial [Eragrostis curvula]
MVNYPTVASGQDEALPPDVLFDVLLRLPAKDICRFRAVCQHWRSLTSDRLFTDAHAARHRAPLIAASFNGDSDNVHVMDLSGQVVKRLPVAAEGLTTLVWSRLDDLVCVANNSDGRCAVINPNTGAVSHLPETTSPEENGGCAYHVFLLGRVESTGQRKVLRLSRDKSDGRHLMSSSVITLLNEDDAGGGGSAQWRPSGRPKFLVNKYSGVVVGGAAYFFWWAAHYPDQHHRTQLWHDGIVPDCVARFDLETEVWSTIRGPRLVDDAEYINHVWEYMSMLSTSTLAELRGHLVLVHNYGCLDLWFLTDPENHLWVQQYSISYPDSVILNLTRLVKPLLLLDDGRIVIFLGHWGILFLYDPANDAFSGLDTERLDEVGLYTGSLLG